MWFQNLRMGMKHQYFQSVLSKLRFSHRNCSQQLKMGFILSISAYFGVPKLYNLCTNKKQSSTSLHSISRSSPVQQKQLIKEFLNLQNKLDGQQKKWSIVSTIWNVMGHVIRFFQLLVIFTPVILLYPFRKLKVINNLWMDLCVKSVENAGVVWIKIFQYLSHRRDIIGDEMSKKFGHLRENAPQHSFEETKKSFENYYGKKIEDVFDQFDLKPLASGSVSQVYKAKYKGKQVVIKARHPGVQKYIEMDVNILFFISKFLAIFSPSFSLPISEDSMRKTLMDQIDFNKEKQNLLVFNKLFKGNKLVKFPQPFVEQTNQAFLVETYVEGLPVTYYEANKHPPNAQIARIGSTTFFEMLIKNNYVHADCHGGNIFAKIYEKPLTFITGIKDYLKYKFQQFQFYFVEKNLKNESLKKLFAESRKQYQKVHKILKNCKQRVVVNLIDVGMVIQLNENDRANFIDLLKYLMFLDGQKCAQMVYNLSSCNGKKLTNTNGNFQNYLNELRQLFSILQRQSLQQVKGVELLGNMLTIIRKNNMKLQGQLATLLTNMLVLQSMAKGLDKDADILKYAIPYLTYAERKQQVIECNTTQFQ